jgi:TetR/AcrR family transcriptional regulator
MGSSRATRERDAEVARRSILNAAEEAFAERGFDGASIQEIADRSGYNKSLIFHYFVNKEGVYREVVTRMGAAMYGWVSQAVAPFVGTSSIPLDATLVRACLESIGRQYFASMLEHPNILRMTAWEAASGWQTLATVRIPAEGQATMDLLVSFIRRAQDAGIVRKELDPALLVFNLSNISLFTLVALPRLSAIGGDLTPDTARVQDQAIQLMLFGALAS